MVPVPDVCAVIRCPEATTKHLTCGQRCYMSIYPKAMGIPMAPTLQRSMLIKQCANNVQEIITTVSLLIAVFLPLPQAI